MRNLAILRVEREIRFLTHRAEAYERGAISSVSKRGKEINIQLARKCVRGLMECLLSDGPTKPQKQHAERQARGIPTQ